MKITFRIRPNSVAESIVFAICLCVSWSSGCDTIVTDSETSPEAVTTPVESEPTAGAAEPEEATPDADPPEPEPKEVTQLREMATSVFPPTSPLMIEDVGSVNFLMATGINDENVAFLKTFPNLVEVNLNRQFEITDAALVHLKELKKLKKLMLQSHNITGKGLAHLSGLSELEIIGLEGVGIDDDALQHLSGFTKLKRLYLSGTSISDAGLTHLEGLKNLKTLNVEETKVTKAGGDRLKQAIPSLKTILY